MRSLYIRKGDMGNKGKIVWEDAIKVAREGFDSHYSMDENQQEIVFKYAKQAPKGGIVVELGVCNGKTASLLIQVSKERNYKYHGIDDFSLTRNYRDVKARLDGLNIPYKLYLSKTQDLKWEKPIDLLIIDAGHDEANIKADCYKWIEFVKKGGVVIFHDYDAEPTTKETSAHWAVRFYADEKTGDWEDLDFLNGLKIRRKPR